MKKILAILVGVFALATGTASAAEPLVNVDWVKANIGKPGIVLLDVRSNANAFQAGHVPGAVFTDYKKDKWRVDKGEVKGLLPPVDHLEALIGRLGIGNDDHVVLIAGGYGAAEMGTATRLYWTFKVLGHDAVSILDGGMTAYLKDKNNPLAKGANKTQAKTFKANLNTELLATADDVKKALANGVPLLDSRPNDQYLGVNKSSKVTRYGTIPGAVNVPGLWLTENNGGNFRDAETIKKLYALAGAPTEGDAITFCNTGHWASLGWFVNYAILGNKKTKMYDASLAEWSRIDGAPIESKVK